jgi:hypothetical protein
MPLSISDRHDFHVIINPHMFGSNDFRRNKILRTGHNGVQQQQKCKRDDFHDLPPSKNRNSLTRASIVAQTKGAGKPVTDQQAMSDIASWWLRDQGPFERGQLLADQASARTIIGV